jgi:hypothetical protein
METTRGDRRFHFSSSIAQLNSRSVSGTCARCNSDATLGTVHAPGL